MISLCSNPGWYVESPAWLVVYTCRRPLDGSGLFDDVLDAVVARAEP